MKKFLVLCAVAGVALVGCQKDITPKSGAAPAGTGAHTKLGPALQKDVQKKMDAQGGGAAATPAAAAPAPAKP